MMKLKNFFFTGALAAVAVGLPSCSSEDFAGQQTRKVPMTVTIAKGDENTRAQLLPDGGDLSCVWQSGDVLTVATDGKAIGTLRCKLSAGETAATATFSGEVEIAGDGEREFSFFYFGKEIPAADGETREFSLAQQEGTLASLNGKDFLSATKAVTVNEENVIAETVAMERHTTFGRFHLSLPDGVAYNGEAITVTGTKVPTMATVTMANAVTFSGDGSIVTHADTNGDFYLTMLPNPKEGMTTDLTFSTEIDGTTYTATLGDHTWKAGEYVRTDNGDGTYGGIAVEFTAGQSGDEDLTGPVFEVNGKKFRFLKANLAYNVDNKEWYLLDEQWSFLCKKGWAYANGSYYGPKESDIDLFGFGCTGLYFSYYNSVLHTPTQFDEQINAPEYFIQKTLYAGQSIDGKQQGYYYPTQNATCNEGYTGSNLQPHGIQDFTMDWGTAYGRQVNNSGHYYTLLSDEWSALQQKYFMCGATITDIANPNNGNKKGLYGCMLLNVTNKAEATALLKQYGATVSSSLSDNLSFTGTNYQYFNYDYVKLTQAQFKELEKAGAVVFLPEAGHTAVSTSYTRTDGYYWTATAGQAYTATIFRFDGNSSPKVFKLDSQSSRIFGCAVRLVKEVK